MDGAVFVGHAAETKRLALIFARRTCRSLRVKVHLKGRRLLIVGLESHETLFEFGQRREITGSEELALDDRKEISIWLSQLAWTGV